MMSLQEFVKEHVKVCGHAGGKPSCARKIYKYLSKWKPDRIDLYNKASKEKRTELLICTK